jgi:hypothetical protein
MRIMTLWTNGGRHSHWIKKYRENPIFIGQYSIRYSRRMKAKMLVKRLRNVDQKDKAPSQ